MSESPILHAVSSQGDILGVVDTRPDDTSHGMAGEDEDDWRLRAASQSIAAPSDISRSPDVSHRWTNSTQDSFEAGGLARQTSHAYSDVSRARAMSNGTEHSGWQPNSYGSHFSYAPSENPPLMGSSPSDPNRTSTTLSARWSSQISPTSPTQQTYTGTGRPDKRDRQYSTDSVNSSVLDILEYTSTNTSTHVGPRSSSLSAASAHALGQKSVPRSGTHSQSVLYEDTDFRSSRGSDGRSTAHASMASTVSPAPGLEVVPRYAQSVEEKIPVENDEYTSGLNRTMPMRQFDTSIDPHSSFYKMKGFCKGAEEMLKGNTAFKRMKRPVGVSLHSTHLAETLD